MSDVFTGRFFVPGPTEVSPAILRAMTGPMIPHRSKAFESLFATVQIGLQEVFQTKQPVLVAASSGTGMMEAGIRCAPAGKVLALVNGAFSARYADIALACGRDVRTLEVPFGDVVPFDRIEELLKSEKFGVVLVPHCETSTGARSDIRGVSDLAHKYGAIALIDSISGLAGIPLQFDDWDLDYVLTGSQKAIALPPGLAFAAVSERYLATVATAPARGRYFDIQEMVDWARKSQTPATPAVSMMYALQAQLEVMQREGNAARWSRHSGMMHAVEAWVTRAPQATGHQVGILAMPNCRSETVTAITLPKYLKVPEVVAAVQARGYTIASGYGPLSEYTVRIGHMGDHTIAGTEALLAVMTDALKGMPNA